MWDLLVRGGRLLDPASGRDGVADVAVHRGRVVATGQALDPASAVETVDAIGLLVVPGLVDIHAHLSPGTGYWGLDPETIAWRTGVTTWVDAGSVGAFGLAGLRETARRSEVAITSLVNVSSIGIPGETGEHHDLANLDVDLAHRVAAAHGGFVSGVKARIDRRTVGDHGIEPLRRGLDLAERLERPLMVHVGYGPPRVTDILPLMRAGDVLTHCASGSPSDLVVDGRVNRVVLEAAERGVRFDLGHGSGALDFEVLEAELAAGIRPTISTDLHAISAHGPAFDMPTVMEKMLAVGWGLEEVVHAATIEPARLLGLSAGALDIGSRADIAIFELVEEDHPAVDVHGQERTSPTRLRNVLTLAGGVPLTERAPARSSPWVPRSEAQQAAEDEVFAELRRSTRPRLQGAADFPEPYPRAARLDDTDEETRR